MEKYTVILLHYNQMKYIEEAIISIMNQTYKNVELIIADDCSPEFDYKKIEQIIKKHNKNKFEYNILSMKENSGTIKNLNNAISHSTGDFIHFLAADDVLYDNKVIERFVNEFDDKSKNIITAQCLMCNDELKDGKIYVNAKMAKRLNKKGVKALFEKMAEYCIYCAGATVYRKNILIENNLFDETYEYIEDWSSWLQLLRKGEMIYYIDFIAYKHRDGGISHSEYTPETLPKHVKKYYQELLDITINEVFPYINDYKLSEQYRIVKKFHDCTNYFGRFVPNLYDYNKIIDKIKTENKKFAIYWRFRKIIDVFNLHFILKLKNLLKYNKVVPITFIIWIICCIIFNKYLNVNNNYILFIYILLYLICYIIVYEVGRLFYLKQLFEESKRYREKNKENEE